MILIPRSCEERTNRPSSQWVHEEMNMTCSFIDYYWFLLLLVGIIRLIYELRGTSTMQFPPKASTPLLVAESQERHLGPGSWWVAGRLGDEARTRVHMLYVAMLSVVSCHPPQPFSSSDGRTTLFVFPASFSHQGLVEWLLRCSSRYCSFVGFVEQLWITCKVWWMAVHWRQRIYIYDTM